MSQYFLTLSSWTIAEMPCCLGRFFWNLVARLVQILREIKESSFYSNNLEIYITMTAKVQMIMNIKNTPNAPANDIRAKK